MVRSVNNIETTTNNTSVVISNAYIISDKFEVYAPSSAYQTMNISPITDDKGFKQSFYVCPITGTITDIFVEQIGESNPVQYDFQIVKQATDNTTETITNSISLINLSNPSGIDNFNQISYYTTPQNINSYLINYYPFTYNLKNTIDNKTLIGPDSFSSDQVQIGVASYKQSFFNSLITPNIINWNGFGTTNSLGVQNANGYTFISFWINVNENYYGNSNSIIMSSKGIQTGNQFQNRNWELMLYNTGGANQNVSSTSGQTYQLKLSANYNWSSSASSSITLDSGANIISNGVWAHVSVYIAPLTISVYLNGKTAIYYNAYLAYDASPLTIGNSVFANMNGYVSYNGYLSDLRIYYANAVNFLSDYGSYTTIGTTYPTIYNMFVNNITTSKNIGGSGYYTLPTSLSVSKGDKIYIKLKENTANTSNFDEIVRAKILIKST